MILQFLDISTELVRSRSFCDFMTSFCVHLEFFGFGCVTTWPLLKTKKKQFIFLQEINIYKDVITEGAAVLLSERNKVFT